MKRVPDAVNREPFIDASVQRFKPLTEFEKHQIAWQLPPAYNHIGNLDLLFVGFTAMVLSILIAISLNLFQTNHVVVTNSSDFSGNWKVDRKFSTYKHLQDLDDLTLVIAQNDNTINVRRIIKEKKRKERVSEFTYYPDGRGEKVSLLFTSQKWNSKTNWVNGSLVSKFIVTQYESLTSDFYYFDYTETWSLSKDTNTLTISTDVVVRNVPNFLRNRIRSESYRKVFHRF